MWRNQRRWLAPGERYALCLVVWNQGSRAKRASEIQPKIPGDVFFGKRSNNDYMCIYIYVQTMYITGDKKNVIYCAPNSWETTQSYTVISSRSNTWSPWQKWLRPCPFGNWWWPQALLPGSGRINPSTNETQKIPKKPCVVNDHDHVRSPVHNKKQVHHLKQVRHAAMFPNFLLRRFYKHLKVHVLPTQCQNASGMFSRPHCRTKIQSELRFL